MKKDKVIYYHDELNDDFEGKNITPIKIDGNYKYIHKNLLWNLSAAILYRGILTPACWLYGKIKFGLKIENKEILNICRISKKSICDCTPFECINERIKNNY